MIHFSHIVDTRMVLNSMCFDVLERFVNQEDTKENYLKAKDALKAEAIKLGAAIKYMNGALREEQRSSANVCGTYSEFANMVKVSGYMKMIDHLKVIARTLEIFRQLIKHNHANRRDIIKEQMKKCSRPTTLKYPGAL